MKLQVPFLLFLTVFSSAAQAQDAAKGEAVFKKCIVCHAVGENARNKQGPPLNGLFGRKAGALEDFSYSPAMKDSGIVWNGEDFTNYIRNPKALVPMGKMAFAGISDEQEIKDLIAYLKQFRADGSRN